MLTSRGVITALVLLVGLMGCTVDSSPPSRAELVGTYKGRYADGTETFEIRDDGTFYQEFQGGGKVIYASRGQWSESPSKVITFKPFLLPHSMSPTAAVNEKSNYPDKMLSGGGMWARAPVRIELGVWPYFVLKVE